MNVIYNNLTKQYDSRQALSIDELIIKKGEITCVIGPNGAGKSTLLKLMSSAPSASGHVRCINGFDKMQTSFVWQHAVLFDRTVIDNLMYPLLLRKVSKDKAKAVAYEVAGQMCIKGLLERYPITLSDGEKQRVMIGRALVYRPKLLLLDEPTANIDPYSIEVVEHTIKERVDNEGLTVVWVTHNLSQAARVADTVIYLEKGRIVEHGNGKSVLLSPKKELTKTFLHHEVLTWAK